MSKILNINEIFYSIQGESSYAGLPCVFVRLTACNLRCTWCDSVYSFHEGVAMELNDLLKKIVKYNCPLIEITGGEPLLQPNVYSLMTALCDLGKQVLLETSGSVDISHVDPRVIKIMDLKCPGSGECDKNLYDNIQYLSKKDEIKFVIADRADYEWANNIVTKYNLTSVSTVLYSPVWMPQPNAPSADERAQLLIEERESSPGLLLRKLADWILEDKLTVRLQTQLHKHVWGACARGV